MTRAADDFDFIAKRMREITGEPKPKEAEEKTPISVQADLTEEQLDALSAAGFMPDVFDPLEDDDPFGVLGVVEHAEMVQQVDLQEIMTQLHHDVVEAFYVPERYLK